jgi:hypothetical protein
MRSNYLDWPTALVKVVNAIIQTEIKVPHCHVFHPSNKNNTVIHVRVFLRHYFGHIPNSAKLKYKELNYVRCIDK